MASSGKRDTGAIASARAAEIYGLNILAENVQVKLLIIYSIKFFILLHCSTSPFSNRQKLEEQIILSNNQFNMKASNNFSTAAVKYVQDTTID